MKKNFLEELSIVNFSEFRIRSGQHQDAGGMLGNVFYDGGFQPGLFAPVAVEPLEHELLGGFP